MELDKIYNMDNLYLLREIESNSVDLIYSDILYNTGRKFKDFNDNLGSTSEAIDWYRPRIVEMKRILKIGGSIFIHCDWHLVHYLKVLMDEVFGESNFRNDIVWRYKRWTSSSNSKFQSMHDNILFYSNGNNTINHHYEELETPRKYQNRKDKKGNVLKDEKGNVIYFPQTHRQIDDVWDIPILNPRAKERTGYQTQKPEKLIERIILSSTDEGDIVADFFCGSGTTPVVAKKLNRRFIACDINKNACEITESRLNKLMQINNT
ncbi:site-specific DNA-methyltransferase [Bacillus velezensis]|uniref:DNA-methyltransferase n=1 Tax=Bacillus velezensis TaxID=492670 RepID=UPI0030D234C1